MTRRTAVAGAVLCALGLVAAGCGSDDNGSSAPSVTFAPAPSTAPGSTSGSNTSVDVTAVDPSAAVVPTTSGLATSGPATSTAPTSAGAASTVPSTASGPTTATATATAPAVQITKLAEVDAPTGTAVRPGDDRIFVVEREGRVVPVGLDGAVGAPVLDITSSVKAGGEQGLLGLAFHPTRPLAYVDYTGTDGGNTHLVEFTVAADGTIDAGSRRELLEIDQPFSNHNGGQLAFGPDGMLYIGMGDGGSGGDPGRRALNAGQLLGKILRIDPTPDGAQPYTIPADNPFVGVSGARGEIWSVGLRNPWRFSFDPTTGDLWIADVGQDTWEEVDVAWADEGGGRGANFGWSADQGAHAFNADQPTQGAVAPVFEYQHGYAGCSITGGARYRGAAIPALDGWYVYADYCAGNVRALDIVDRGVAREVVLGQVGAVSSVAAGPNGELYVTSVDDNALLVIRAA